MREDNRIGDLKANFIFNLFNQVVSFLHRPIIGDENVDVDKFSRAGLSGSKGVIINFTLVNITVKNLDNFILCFR